MTMPKDRSERKKREYSMAVVRTVFNVVAGIVGIVTLILSFLIHHKVYFS